MTSHRQRDREEAVCPGRVLAHVGGVQGEIVTAFLQRCCHLLTAGDSSGSHALYVHATHWSLSELQLGCGVPLQSQQVIHNLVVYLDVRHRHFIEVAGGRRGKGVCSLLVFSKVSKDVLACSRDDASLRPVRRSPHREGLPSRALAVCEYGAMGAAQHSIHYIFGVGVVHFFLISPGVTLGSAARGVDMYIVTAS